MNELWVEPHYFRGLLIFRSFILTDIIYRKKKLSLSNSSVISNVSDVCLAEYLVKGH